MNPTLLEQLINALEHDFHSDTEHLLSNVRSELENYKQNKQEKYQRPSKENALPVIEISNINKQYNFGHGIVNALKDISFTIYEGEIVALVGPSGSGKSTLLNLIGGLDTPTSGDIVVNGTPLKTLNDYNLSEYRNQTIGFIFQFFNLQPYLTVQENVEIPLIFRGAAEKYRKAASQKAVEAVGLKDRITHLPNQLSGGQMQRVAIARSIVNEPKIILADEPTGNLDRATGIEIMNLIKEINRTMNTTVIIVTHDNFIANQADRIITLSDGKLV